jgi:hypothetical protein
MLGDIRARRRRREVNHLMATHTEDLRVRFVGAGRRAIAERMLGERNKDGLADQVDEAAVKTALALARQMKEQLSDRDQTSGRLEIAGVPSFHALGRAEFEAMIASHIARTVDIARNVLTDADIRPADVQGVVLVFRDVTQERSTQHALAHLAARRAGSTRSRRSLSRTCVPVRIAAAHTRQISLHLLAGMS